MRSLRTTIRRPKTSPYCPATSFTGMGDKFDKKAGQEFGPGGFAALPAKMNHFGWTISPTIIQVGSEGPADIVYVNPADHPSKR